MFVKLVQDIYIERKSTLSILCTDVQKAFDTINRGILWKILDKYGLNENELNRIKLLYYKPYTQINVNGSSSIDVCCDAGVRQGCPSAMLLFVIYIDLLLKNIQTDQMINSIYIPGMTEHVKFIAHADDISFFLVDQPSANRTVSIIKKFSKLTGMVVNENKCKMMNVYGDLRCDMMNVNKVNNANLLGIWYGLNSREKTVEVILQKVESAIEEWDDNWYYMPERVKIINKAVYSRIIYQLYTTSLRISDIKLIERKIFNFVWKKTYEPMSRRMMKNRWDNGGWGIWDLKGLEYAVQLSNICNVLKTRNHPLMFVAEYILGPIVKTFTQIRGSRPFLVNSKGKYRNWRQYLRQIMDEDSQVLLDDRKVRPSILYKYIHKQVINQNMLLSSYNWNDIWKNVGFLPAEWRETSWRIIQNVVMTKSFLNTHCYKIDVRCLMCRREETTIHVFFECPIAAQVWRWVERVCKTKITWTNVKYQTDYKCRYSFKYMINWIIGLTKRILWKSRCELIFEQRKWNATFLVMKIKEEAIRKINIDCENMSEREFACKYGGPIGVIWKQENDVILFRDDWST
ncbi:uncharacterized protein LOC111627368 [Centruroides sculpturatus]|uniref:uncharacterized protein LOC111627368 n=1 Tax=Centruroides sculpturatus TaxID=218467 RepID=UPI000C6D77B5|nr:uncharacterized protein LOC111627368 [Centruroides sculpturatus]